MKHFPFVLIGLLGLVSCDDNDDQPMIVPETVSYSHYHFRYMDVPTSVAGTSDPLVDVTWTAGKITKVVGGLSEMDQASGYSHRFNKQLYRDIAYDGNRATIVCKTSFAGITAPEQKQIAIFDNNGRLIQRIKVSDYDSNYRDTINCIYEGNRLKRYELRHNHLISRSEVYYNAQANVDSIVTKGTEWIDGAYQFNPTSKKRTVAIFKDYDQTGNPFGNFALLEEVFFRSLSANNYEKFEKIGYNYNNEIESHSFFEWNFVYEEGQINFAM